MKELQNITALQNGILAALKSIFNMDKKVMSVICIKVQSQQKQKSPYHYLHRE